MRVTVQYVNFPLKAEAKYGNIKTNDGQTIMIPVAQLALYQKGMSCDVPTEQKTWGTGDAARPVTVAVGAPSQVTQGAPTGAPAQPRQAYHPSQQSPPAASQGTLTDKQIFVCGVVQQAMASGKFEASSIRVLTEEAAAAWAAHLATF